VDLCFHPRRFFQPGDRVAVAVSGGADSVALLALLLEARDELGIVVSVAHYNHRLRGAESDADAQFVEQLANAGNIEYLTAASDTLHDRNVEALARHDRYAFFSQLVREGRVKKIATAHTAEDQAETVLTRLLRGSGTAGISGILPSLDGGTIVRPLLETRRADLRAWATALGLAWREDASNLDDRFLRNRIRHELLPLLERGYNSAIVEVLGRAAEVARADEAEWQSQTEELAARLLVQDDGQEGAWKLPLADFVKLSEGQQRRLLRAAILRAKGDLRRVDFRHVEQVRLLALKRGAGGISARSISEVPGLKIQVHGNWIQIGV
jgi:tRNA(Ile)-lysidine synthase